MSLRRSGRPAEIRLSTRHTRDSTEAHQPSLNHFSDLHSTGKWRNREESACTAPYGVLPVWSWKAQKLRPTLCFAVTSRQLAELSTATLPSGRAQPRVDMQWSAAGAIPGPCRAKKIWRPEQSRSPLCRRWDATGTSPIAKRMQFFLHALRIHGEPGLCSASGDIPTPSADAGSLHRCFGQNRPRRRRSMEGDTYTLRHKILTAESPLQA